MPKPILQFRLENKKFKINLQKPNDEFNYATG